MEKQFEECARALRIALERVEHLGRIRHCGCGAYREAGDVAVRAVLALSPALDAVLAIVQTHPGTAQNLTRCRFDGLCSARRASACLGGGAR